MMHTLLKIVFLLIGSWTCCLASAAEKSDAGLESIQLDQLNRYVQTLADDSFEGREAGSRGGQAIGVYLAEQFERIGLKPAGVGDSYFQPFGAGYRNIIGLLPGSDPELADQYLVVSGHYDHVGYGTPQNSRGVIGIIHNGADDNASGVAGVLEIAEAMAQYAEPPKRSILFILWDAEEKGLLGSKHWVQHPTVPLDQISLMINIDMIGQLRDNRLEVYGYRTGFGLREWLSRHNAATNIDLQLAWELKENSDHYPFFSKGIPVLLFHTGLHEFYHHPNDDFETINSQGMFKITTYIYRLVMDLANRTTAFKFREKSKEEVRFTDPEATGEKPARRLGIQWKSPLADATYDGELPGITISAVAPDSVAAKAGLEPQDRILAVNRQSITSGDLLRDLIQTSPSPVELQVQRPGELEPLELVADFTQQPFRLGISWREDDAEPGSIVVVQVFADTLADQAGLKRGDRIYSINGQHLEDGNHLRRLIDQAQGPNTLEIERSGNVKTLTLETHVPAEGTSEPKTEPEPTLPAQELQPAGS